MVLPKLEVLRHMTLFDDKAYNCFPNMVMRPDGHLLLGFRNAPNRHAALGKITHIDPASRAVCISSPDGQHWDRTPAVLYDDFVCGVQDPCLNVLEDGSLFATFFMWKVFPEEDAPAPRPRDHAFGQWVGRPTDAYTVRSLDGGRTWDSPLPVTEPGAIRGNCVELEDGSILAPLYYPDNGTYQVNLVRTEDRGRTWTRRGMIPAAAGYSFYEPTLYRTPSGKLVAFIRSLSKEARPADPAAASPLFTAESLDNGATWSEPAARGFSSPSPFNAVRLNSGDVLLTYGFRTKPYGIRGMVLDAECANWSEASETVLREDAPGKDIGYTSAVQLKDGRILVAYYYYGEEEGSRTIEGTWCCLS